MKKFDAKKLLVFIIIIVILVALGFVILKFVNKDKVSETDKQTVEANITSYYLNLSKGYSTTYDGLDVLYSYDKTTFEDLTEQEIIYTAISYLNESDINYTISADYMNDLKKSNAYGSMDDYRIYSGESIRQAVKELFGVDTFQETATPTNFLYDIYYDVTYDCYLLKRNDVTDYKVDEASMDYSIISTENQDGKLVTTVAIAYVYNDGGNIMYMKDPEGTQIVVENLEKKEFPTDKIDEFTKYKFTLKQTQDKKYVFESVEKVK